MVIYLLEPCSQHLNLGIQAGPKRYLALFKVRFEDFTFVALVRAEAHDGPCRRARVPAWGTWEGRSLEWADDQGDAWTPVGEATRWILDDWLDERVESGLAAAMPRA